MMHVNCTQWGKKKTFKCFTKDLMAFIWSAEIFFKRKVENVPFQLTHPISGHPKRKCKAPPPYENNLGRPKECRAMTSDPKCGMIYISGNFSGDIFCEHPLPLLSSYSFSINKVCDKQLRAAILKNEALEILENMFFLVIFSSVAHQETSRSSYNTLTSRNVVIALANSTWL